MGGGCVLRHQSGFSGPVSHGNTPKNHNPITEPSRDFRCPPQRAPDELRRRQNRPRGGHESPQKVTVAQQRGEGHTHTEMGLGTQTRTRTTRRALTSPQGKPHLSIVGGRSDFRAPPGRGGAGGAGGCPGLADKAGAQAGGTSRPPCPPPPRGHRWLLWGQR